MFRLIAISHRYKIMSSNYLMVLRIEIFTVQIVWVSELREAMKRMKMRKTISLYEIPI